MGNRISVQFGLAVFLGAFLLFQIQPVIGKSILPWYGGAPGVWTTALLFFQVVLVGGYAYAHLSVRLLPPMGQMLLHVGLLVAAAFLLPVGPDVAWKPDVALSNPTWHILTVLAGTVGVACFMLASTGPLLQAWSSRSGARESPYRFYALSNAGSLLALVSYPVLIEPGMTLRAQKLTWSGAFIVFAVSSGAVAVWASRRKGTRRSTNGKGSAALPSRLDRVLWLALPAAASILLLAVTNQMTQQVAVVPFLWILPLSLYLLTFILCFEGRAFYRRVLFIPALLVASIAVIRVLSLEPAQASLPLQIGVYSFLLFVACMVCHGELAGRKPDPVHLTSFYLMLAIGGALGGVFVALVAPMIFDRFLELHVGILATFALLLLSRFMPERRHADVGWSVPARTVLAVGCLLIAGALIHQALTDPRPRNGLERNFYGVLWIEEVRAGNARKNRDVLYHGEIRHGSQFIHPDERCVPTGYFARDSGVALAIEAFPRSGLRIGVVGLGVGVLAAYAGEDDLMRFYEVDPAVLRIAQKRFKFVTECGRSVNVVLGDARVSLEREAPQDYDILVLDAFRGDALPVHLLTVEAFKTYLGHLKPDGVIAAHISSLHFNLKPVFWKMADHLGLQTLVLIQPRVGAAVLDGAYETESVWLLMTNNEQLLSALPRAGPSIRHPQILVDADLQGAFVAMPEPGDEREVRLWTDDYSNPFQMLKWGQE